MGRLPYPMLASEAGWIGVTITLAGCGLGAWARGVRNRGRARRRMRSQGWGAGPRARAGRRCEASGRAQRFGAERVCVRKGLGIALGARGVREPGIG
jgi:hypothetical protein